MLSTIRYIPSDVTRVLGIDYVAFLAGLGPRVPRGGLGPRGPRLLLPPPDFLAVDFFEADFLAPAMAPPPVIDLSFALSRIRVTAQKLTGDYRTIVRLASGAARGLCAHSCHSLLG